MELTGETHQGILDLSFFRIIPNLTIMAPKDFKELQDMMEYAITLKSPVVIRYPRGGESTTKFKTHTYLQLKKGEILTSGQDVTIIAIGNQVAKAMNIFNKLKKYKINAEVINARFLKPFPKYQLLSSINKTKFVITIEDNTMLGGLGTAVKEIIAEKRLNNIIMRNYAYPDVFVEHGKPEELEKKYKMDEDSIFYYIKEEIERKNTKKGFKVNNKKKY